MRCPVCRAENNVTEQCRRCKADLTLLAGLEHDRAAYLAAAELHAGRGEGQECLADAQRGHALRAGGDSLRLLALGYLLKKDFAGAWRAYRRCADTCYKN
jgi:hypothetical protein